MKVKFLLKNGELTSNISRQTYDIILACWHNNEKFTFSCVMDDDYGAYDH